MKTIPKGERIVEQDTELLSPSSRISYFPMVVARAKGAKIWDVDGNEYIDFLAGAAVANVGHSHPRVVQAIKEQADMFLHHALPYMYSELALNLSKKLVEITPGSFPKRVAFGLSGSDANDGALKLARSATNRQKIISFLGSYHGTTIGAITLSGITLRMRRKLGPLIPEVYHIPFPDCYRCIFGGDYPECGMRCMNYLRVLLDTTIPPEEVAMIAVEPIQGDAGIVVPPPNYLPELKRLCEDNGILFAAEEVQTGFGRTGKMFALDHWSVVPDIMILGKAIASGLPLSALVSRKELMERWEAPAHLFTMEANPLSCVAALVTIDIIEREKLCERAERLGQYAKKRFLELKEAHPLIGDVRGKGLMLGVDLIKDHKTKQPARKETLKVDWRAWEKGLILIHLGKSVLRIAPPLTIEKEELDRGIDIVGEAIGDVEKDLVPDSVLQRMGGW
jgi:4-aminobutyrate aminotransferase